MACTADCKQMCIGWLIAIPLAGAVDLVRIVRSNPEPKLPAPEYQNQGAGGD